MAELVADYRKPAVLASVPGNEIRAHEERTYLFQGTRVMDESCADRCPTISDAPRKIR